MKKIINAPKDVVEEMVAGLVGAYPDYVKQLPDTMVVARSDDYDQVALVMGGQWSRTGLMQALWRWHAKCSGFAGKFLRPDTRPDCQAIKATDKGREPC